MTAHLRGTGAAVAASALLSLWAAGPALAHGAPTDPVSRVYACSPSGGSARTAACRAAIAANGTPFVAWDNLRVAGVGGRDRQVIPDGKLCSAGLPAYKGLDLARPDWPSTRLPRGGRLSMAYASTIAHTGTFKLYLTKPGYDPTEPLKWSDLPARPFAEVRDPALTNGAYHIDAKLPADRTGRQMLYTIWQNSSTPDTYYSCSDVVFSGTTRASKAGAAKKRAGESSSTTAKPGPSAPSKSAGAPPASATATSAARQAAEATTADSTPVASDTAAGSGPSAPLMAGGAAAVLVLTGGAALTLRLRRR